MITLHSGKSLAEIEKSFNHFVEHAPKHLFLYNRYSSRERYFGKFKKNRFWITHTSPNQIVSGVMRVLYGEIVEEHNHTTIKLKYKIFTPIKLNTLIDFAFFDLAFLITGFKINPEILPALFLLSLLLLLIGYCMIMLFCIFCDSVLGKGKEKKKILMNYVSNHIIYKRIPCPCCGNYTVIDNGAVPIVDICPVCFWQYDETAQEKSDIIIGPNHGVTFNMAKENYKKFGACSQDCLQYVRKPTNEELPENNK